MNAFARRLSPLLVLAFSTALAAQSVNITFKVKPPAGTPGDAKIYVTGDADALKVWTAAGVELKKGDDGTYAAVVALPKDHEVAYKITRGSWETVEKAADGSELANRILTPTKDEVVDVAVAAWADQAQKAAAPAAQPATPASPAQQPRRPTRTGDIREHARFHSKILNNDRDVYVYLPPGYADKPNDRYAVLYMHDGQNIFDAATNPNGAGEWKADEAAERLIKTGKIEPIIIVGISNTPARLDEYTLIRDEQHNAGGKGDAYMKFVTDELKPFIDQTYRTKTDPANTGSAGSSLGATISLELCRARPDVFGKCAVISPAFWWANGDLPKRIETDNAFVKKCRIWLDIGTAESGPRESEFLVAGVKIVANELQQAGAVEGQSLHVEFVRGAQHTESAWAARIDRVLMFLYPRPL